jgi:2-oxoglutarate/2-oxoacid ferredoxin oxidoreductase subunit alpha
MKTSINIKIGGQAGEGIKVSGLVLARALTRLGFWVFGYSEYPSLIRGGHNTYQIHASVEKVYSQVKKVDLLIALNQETILLHQDELADDSLVLYDPGEFDLPKEKLKGKYIDIKLIELTKKAGGKDIMANMTSLGAILTLLGLPLTSLEKMIEEQFSKKGKEVVVLNQKVTQAGKQYIEDKFSDLKINLKLPEEKFKRMILTGNEAVALGAIAGGLKFYCAYPMTPSTSILHYLASKAQKAEVFVKHVEDEISAVNMAIGASFAGARAMTATSGGGLCLMAEGITMSGISEIPLVIVNSQRPGPALGMPTWTGQGDLMFVLHLGHDEFPRIVLAPGDAREAFEQTKLALNLAEEYQLPVFILIDKFISESDYSLKPFDSIHKNKRYSFADKPEKGYLRYKLTKTGVSLRSIPDQEQGVYCANSYEHTPDSLGTEDGQVRSEQVEKRLHKLNGICQVMPEQPVYGNPKAKVGIISWGSNKVIIQQALNKLDKVSFLHLNWLWPFPDNQVLKFIESKDKVYVLEANATGQLKQLIKKQTAKDLESVLKYNGRPFYPDEIIRELNSK